MPTSPAQYQQKENNMTDHIFKDCEAKMKKAIDALHSELTKIRTGRAHPSLLEGVMVVYYGNPTPLNQVANVSVGDARTLVVTPWERNLVSAIEKAILTADLGLNPASMGETIRVPLPPLTEERRKSLIKLVRASGENAKVSVRNLRRDSNTQLKDLLKAKQISEDDERRAQDKIQQLTDKFTKEVDHILSVKEADLMEV
jgi:ribosome recycling factor